MSNAPIPDLNATGFGDASLDPIGPEHDEARAAARSYLMAISTLAERQRRRFSSYDLKHRAEQWWRRCGGKGYIPNGVMIAAAIDLKLTVTPQPHRGGVDGLIHLPRWGEQWL